MNTTVLTSEDIVQETIRIAKEEYSLACTFLEHELQAYATQLNTINGIGLMFYHKVQYDLACRCFYFVLNIDNKQFRTHNNLGLTLNRFGLGAKAVEHYRQALAVKKDYHPARSNLAYALHYFGETGRQEILDAHLAIADNVFNESQDYLINRHINKSPQRRLNIAYVSSDFRNHAVGRFMQGILEHHDRSQFAVHIFDNRSNNNDETAKIFKALPLRWHHIDDVKTEQACKLISANNIDILVDLSGHTGGGRPDIFSQRVTPVQITYLGYPNTSGLRNMDFRIGDDFADLEEYANQNSERMLRLPHPIWNYTPWPDMPDPSALPYDANGYITFGSANNHAKIQQEWMSVWAKALVKVPNSKFKIKSRALKNPETARELLAFFKDRGVANERIQIEHYSPTRLEHWQTLCSFDISLDSFPYNGTTTTCDLLCLGVPMISRAGNSHVSRTSASIMRAINLGSWIANDEQSFVDICVAKANNISELRKLRQSLRHRFMASTLGHAPLFMQQYEKLLRTAWTRSMENLGD